MKKKIFLMLAMIHLIAGTLKADSIPNGGFESWIHLIWAEDPEFWFTGNGDLVPPTVYKDSDAFAGNFAMKLIYEGIVQPMAGCGFPLTSHPLNVGGYVKNNLGTGDSTTFKIQLFLNQQLIDSGYFVFYGGINPNYSQFEIPISQNSSNADSCLILINGGMISNSTITFDELQINFTSNISLVDDVAFELFPNPCQDLVILKSNSIDLRDCTIEVYDLIGKKSELIFEKKGPVGYIVELNTSSLKPGVWIINLQTANKIQSRLLVKME